MDPGRDNSVSIGMEVSSGKRKKDPSKRSVDSTPDEDGRKHHVRHALLRGDGSKPGGQGPSTDSAVRSSRSMPTPSSTVTSGSHLSQSTLADFGQTAPTVSTLTGVGKAFSASRKNPLDNVELVEAPPKKRISLETYRFEKGNTANKLLDSGQTSPLRKAPSAWSASPSPPRRRGPPTPLRDEVDMQPDHRVFDQGHRHSFDNSQGFNEGGMNQPLFRGIPQGSSMHPPLHPQFGDYTGGGQRFMSFSAQPHQPVPDLMAVFSDGFSKILNKIGDMSGSRSAGSAVDNSASSAVDNSNPVVVKQEDESSDSSSEDESFMSWSGHKLVNKTPAVVLSDEGTEAWKALKGIDDSGIASGLFKKIARRDKDISFYSKGSRCFAPQEKNLELPKLTGYKDRDEKKLYMKDKSLGAIGSAIVAAVDASREFVEDVNAAKKDFEEDKLEDIKKEAVDVCASSSMWVNNKIVTHLIKALKMVAVESAITTMERRNLAETEVGQEDMRKILADSPPDDVYLYGGGVKDTVQKARDASLLSKAFTRYGNKREKPWEKNAAYRPKEMRFKAKKFSKFRTDGAKNKEGNPKQFRFKKNFKKNF